MKDRKKRRALTVWQKRTTHIPAHFKNRARRKFLLWKRTALLMRSLACCRLKQPFAQWRRRAELRKSRQGTMINALGALRNPGLKHAFNTWWFKVRPKPHTHSRAFTTQPAAALPGSARSGRVSLPTCRALSSFIPARLSRQIIERMERREWLRQQIAGLRAGSSALSISGKQRSPRSSRFALSVRAG